MIKTYILSLSYCCLLRYAGKLYYYESCLGHSYTAKAPRFASGTLGLQMIKTYLSQVSVVFASLRVGVPRDSK